MQEDLSRKERGLMKARDLARIVKSQLPFASVYLFGSYAWGRPKWDSDLDFALVVPKDKISHSLAVQARRLMAQEEYSIDVILLDEEKMNQAVPGMIHFQIRNDGVAL